ncbi:MAG: helix-turn-helix transcriptional regulator [Lentilactobacillus hilgardii]|uniref:helix-turn-helix domain-containing protein n=1 Tax=Lentilactobacillus hilgardii TaxID=1588 RepID=UPI0039E7C9CA
MSVQQNIKRIREARGITQVAVAGNLGITPMKYYRLENINKTIDPNYIIRIAHYLGVDEATFFDKELTESVINSLRSKQSIK